MSKLSLCLSLIYTSAFIGLAKSQPGPPLKFSTEPVGPGDALLIGLPVEPSSDTPYTVRFGEETAQVLRISAQGVLVIVPQVAPGLLDVSVVSASGENARGLLMIRATAMTPAVMAFAFRFEGQRVSSQAIPIYESAGMNSFFNIPIKYKLNRPGHISIRRRPVQSYLRYEEAFDTSGNISLVDIDTLLVVPANQGVKSVTFFIPVQQDSLQGGSDKKIFMQKIALPKF